jgi:hypothetical protein
VRRAIAVRTDSNSAYRGGSALFLTGCSCLQPANDEPDDEKKEGDPGYRERKVYPSTSQKQSQQYSLTDSESEPKFLVMGLHFLSFIDRALFSSFHISQCYRCYQQE